MREISMRLLGIRALILPLWIVLLLVSQASALSFLKPKEQDLRAPISWCAKGDGVACFYVAQNLLFGDKKSSDIVRAKAFYHRACALKVANACYELSKLQAHPTRMYVQYWRLWEREIYGIRARDVIAPRY